MNTNRRIAINLMNLVVSFALISISTPGFAQLKKGKKLFEEGRYSEAIKPLKKDFQGEEQNFEAGLLLAKCHYQLQDYQEAVDVLTAIGEENILLADDRRFYADVLIANDDFSGAYVTLIQLISEDQSDPFSFLWLDKVSDLLEWDTLETASNIRSVRGINSFYNEYAPYFDPSGELWFVSDLSTVQAIFPNSYSNQPIHLYYKTRLGKSDGTEVKKPSWLMKNREYYYHDGPIAKWTGEDKYVLTLRDIDAPIDGGLIGLYFSQLTGAEEDIIPFKYNEKYNTGHATFMNDGKRMIFASDRPGGYGQMDLWYCDWENGSWTPPVNMGPNINTPSNELFPTFFDTRLYFSSDRRDKGYGGLDIYFSSELYDFESIENLRAPINSAYDEFGVTFINAKSGFFASNRRNGEGGDDIYAFTYSPEQIEIELTRLQVINAQVPEGTQVEILDGYGDVIASTQVGNGGIISTSNLKSKEIYTLKLSGVDLPEEALLATLSSSGDLVATFPKTAENEFKFELLPQEEYLLAKQENKDDSRLQFDIDGKIVADESVSVSGIPVALIGASGAVLSTSKTEEDGRFTLSGATMDQGYTIETEGLEEYHEIDVYGESGAITQSLSPIGENKFAYTRSAPAALWMTTATIKIPQVFAIVLNNEPIEGEEVVLYDGEDNELKKPSVDEDGFMDMGSLTAGNAYRLYMPQRDLGFEDRLVILDGQGDTSQTVRPFDGNNYFFEYLLYRDYGIDMADPVAVAPVIQKKIFKARITKYNQPDQAQFLLKDLVAGTIDTLNANSKGIMILRDIDPSHQFELFALQGDLDEGSIIQIYNEDNTLIYESAVVNQRYFNLEFLDQDDYALSKESNSDDSSLNFAFTGTFESDLSKDSKVQITNSSGQVVGETTISAAKAFRFENLDPTEEYNLATAAGVGLGALSVRNERTNTSIEIFPQANNAYKIPKATSVYKVLIKSSKPSSEAYILRDLESGVADTLRTDENGELAILPEIVDHEYSLSIVEGELPENSRVQVFDHNNDLIYEAINKDSKSFIIKFLEQEDYALAKEDNDDLSMLSFGLSGSFNASGADQSKVELFNNDGLKIAETYSGKSNEFVFTNIPSARRFIIRADFEDKDATVMLIDGQTGKSSTFPRLGNGDFRIDFQADTEQLTLKEGKKEVTVSKGAKFSLSEVYYDFNSYRLKSESKQYLDELVSLLNQNPAVRIEIRSHTDSRGPSNYNKLLSQKRAESVVTYLTSRGVESSRLKAIGLGESELTNKCADGIRCTNAEHAKNRRTEFAFIE